MAAVLQPQGSMASGFPSLISRRTAGGNNLPGPLELPVNTLTAKFGGPLSSSALPTVINHQQSQSSINALLTPPSHIPGESLSPVSSTSNSTSTNPAAIGLPPYTPTGYSYGSGSYPPATGPTPQPAISQAWSQSLSNNTARGRFSPSLASLMRNPSTGSPSESIPPSTNYDLGALPPFPNTLVHQGPISPPAQPYPMSSQAPPAPLHSPVSAHDPYMQKLPPTPGYYQSMTPQQSHFPQNYSSGSPSIPSPLSATAPSSRISPLSAPMPGYGRPYSNLSMGGLQSPGHIQPNYGPPAFHQQAIFNSGHAAHMQQMYGHQPNQAPLDRPFKCDQCPQSFNRNHDLKRHKRIHLAVKPFPCKYCDKSFSRKDALKGCGKTSSSDVKSPNSTKEESSSGGEQSPVNVSH